MTLTDYDLLDLKQTLHLALLRRTGNVELSPQLVLKLVETIDELRRREPVVIDNGGGR